MGPSTAAIAEAAAATATEAAEATVAGNCYLQRATGAAAAATSIKTDQVDRRQAQQKSETARDSGKKADGCSVCVCVERCCCNFMTFAGHKTCNKVWQAGTIVQEE